MTGRDSTELVMMKSDPLQKAKETRASAARLQAFSEKISVASNALASEKIDDIQAHISHATETEEAAKALAFGSFDSSFLAGTGADLWHATWDAAQVFSEGSAYEGELFPFTGKMARCVLCQQNLDLAVAAT